MSYTIIDEPKPSALQHLVINPIWPLFAFMLGSGQITIGGETVQRGDEIIQRGGEIIHLSGSYLSWIFFIFNSIAIGSPKFKQEISTIVIASILSFLYLLFTFNAYDHFEWTFNIQYIFLGLIAIEIACSYAVFQMQIQSFQIYEYYGGLSKNGFPILIIAFFIGSKIQLEVFKFFVSIINLI